MGKEVPILFSTPMVQALLDGRKTQTRRIVKFPLKDKTHHLTILECDSPPPVSFAKWEVGDVLWVKETMVSDKIPNDRMLFLYKADITADQVKHFPYQSALFMKKVDARIWLQITDIRVERAQDISEEYAKAEGVEEILPDQWKDYQSKDFISYRYAKGSFKSLWQSINGEESWQANPWVWTLTFNVLSTNGRPQSI